MGNQISVFSDIPGFCVIKCFWRDPIHVLLEGVDRLAVKWHLTLILATGGKLLPARLSQKFGYCQSSHVIGYSLPYRKLLRSC
jgi:hypothetical protein